MNDLSSQSALAPCSICVICVFADLGVLARTPSQSALTPQGQVSRQDAKIRKDAVIALSSLHRGQLSRHKHRVQATNAPGVVNFEMNCVTGRGCRYRAHILY